MAFGLEKTNVTLDDIPFEAFREVNTENHYFAERVAIMGIFSFGTVEKGEEARIDLDANGITTPIILDSLFAFTPNGTSDEVLLNLYVKIGRTVTRIGRQRISAGQMPYDIPKGIIRPGMILGVEPTKSDSTIAAYVKPVAVSFTATPVTFVNSDGGDSGGAPAA